jgi:hypothetical protein
MDLVMLLYYSLEDVHHLSATPPKPVIQYQWNLKGIFYYTLCNTNIISQFQNFSSSMYIISNLQKLPWNVNEKLLLLNKISEAPLVH